MSGIIVRGHALALVKRLLAPPAREDVMAAVTKVDDRFPQFIYELALEACVPQDELYQRASALVLQYAAVQLADDLADGECTYLTPASRVGPGAQWLLAHLYLIMLERTSVPSEAVRNASEDFVRTGQGQQEEVRTSQWDLNRATRAAASLNGAQYRAYFRLLFAGTRFDAWGAEHGVDFGFALHVVGDRTQKDARWTTLEVAEQVEISKLGLEAVCKAKGSGLPALEAQLDWFETVLKGA